MTLARDAQEAELLRDALGLLAQLGVPVAVADGGSPETFVRFLAKQPRVHVAHPRRQGLVGQIAASLQEAAEFDTAFVLYTESDKHVFFRDHVNDFVRRAPAGADVGIVVASRSPAGFATFPPLQRRTEATINDLTGDVVGHPGDYSYGPFLVHRALVPYLDRVPAEIGWGWRHFLFAIAHRVGYRVATIEGEYSCPPAQGAGDATERVHRLKQLAQNVQGLVLGLTMAPGSSAQLG